MGNLVIRAANELGIGSHVMVREFAEFPEPLVTVAYPPKVVQQRVPVQLFMEPDLTQVKIILSDMATKAQRS